MRKLPFAGAAVALFALCQPFLVAEDKKEPAYDGKSLTRWTQLLKNDDVKVRRQAVNALNAMKRDQGADLNAAVPALVEALKDKDTDVRVEVALLLAQPKSAPHAKAAIGVLEETLKDKEGKHRVRAAGMLWHITKHEASIPVLVEALKDKDKEVRLSATTYLRIGPEAKAAGPALIAAIKDEYLPVSRGAAYALSIIGSEAAKEAVPVLVETLKTPSFNEYPQHRDDAARALADIGPHAKAAVPALLKSLKEEEQDSVRAMVALALWRIEKHKTAIPALIDGLTNSDDYGRERTAIALADIGPDAKAAVPALIKALKDTNKGVREQAGYALKEIDPEAAKKAGVK